MALERRLHPRKAWRQPVVFENEFGEGMVYLYSRDISMGGIFLEESPPFRLGTRLFVSFALPGSELPMRLTGQVVRMIEHDKERQTQDAGIRFLELSQSALQQLSHFLQTAS